MPNAEPNTSGKAWFEVYCILTEMGRLEEAKAALLHAKEDNDVYASNVTTHDRIEAAMRKLGIRP